MKRYFSFAFLILLLTVFLLPTTAQSEESHISDNADLLLSFEEAILNSRSAWLQEDQVELLFYTDNDASGQEAILDSVKTEFLVAEEHIHNIPATRIPMTPDDSLLFESVQKDFLYPS